MPTCSSTLPLLQLSPLDDTSAVQVACPHNRNCLRAPGGAVCLNAIALPYTDISVLARLQKVIKIM